MRQRQWVHRMDQTFCTTDSGVVRPHSDRNDIGVCEEHDRRVDLVEVTVEPGVFHPIVTHEGAVFEMFTNGWAVGYKVTAPGKPTRYVLLNASGAQASESLDDTDVFLYVEDQPDDLSNSVCFVEVWGD